MIITTVECDNCEDCIKVCPTSAIRIREGRVISCLTCGICAEVCPTKAIRQNKYGGYVVDMERCSGCKLCEVVCPIDSITVEDGKVSGICTRCGKCVQICPKEARVDGYRFLVHFLKYEKPILIERLSDLAYVEKEAHDLRAELAEREVEVKPISKRTLVIDRDLCNLCGKCEWACPAASPVVTMETEGCTSCGLCVEVCPFDAIDLEKHEIGARCIRCLKCLEVCPRNAIETRDDGSLSIKVAEDRKGEIRWCSSCGLCVEHCPPGALYLRKGRVYFDPAKCDKCMKCIEICPTGVLRYDEKSGLIRGNCLLCNICVDKCDQKAMKLVKVQWDGKASDKCVACGICVEVCPEKAITILPGKTIAVDLEKCTLCEICASYCPYDAIPILSTLPKKKIIEGSTTIDKEICIDCGLCEEHCPNNAISDREVNLEKCIFCGGCAHICPVSAITCWRRFEDGKLLEVS